ncbi:MAG: fibronectin type III domain-containing protein [Candidatus Bipolaricaulaceae bacterium]
MRSWRLIVLGGLGLVLIGCDLIRLPSLLPPTEAPKNLSASFGTVRAQIELRWQAVEGAERYEIYRAKAQDGEYHLVGNSTTTTFSDLVGEENQGKWYWYRVRACNAAGCGPESEAVRGYAGRPPAPENINASQGSFPDKIRVSWDPMPGAQYYQVFRDTAKNGIYNACVADSVTENSWFDENVLPATWYYYKIRACNSFGCSELSQAASGYCGLRPIPFAEDAEPN